jgi:tetratricopeptide (TPR) repeat protein
MVSNNISSPPIVVLAITLSSIIFHIYQIGLKRKTKPLRRWVPLIGRQFLTLPLLLLVLIVILIGFWPFFCLNPFLANLHYKRSQALIASGKIETAEKKLKRAIYYIPEQPYYYQALGRIHLFRFKNTPLEEHIEKAITNFSRAIDINERQPEFYREVAQAMEAAQGIAIKEESLTPMVLNYYKKAISLAPKNPFYRFNLANYYRKIDSPIKAIRSLKEAIGLEPNFINAHFYLAKIYGNIAKEKESLYEERTVELLRKRFESYNPPTHYERLLLMMPEEFLGKAGET